MNVVDLQHQVLVLLGVQREADPLGHLGRLGILSPRVQRLKSRPIAHLMMPTVPNLVLGRRITGEEQQMMRLFRLGLLAGLEARHVDGVGGGQVGQEERLAKVRVGALGLGAGEVDRELV